MSSQAPPSTLVYRLHTDSSCDTMCITCFISSILSFALQLHESRRCSDPKAQSIEQQIDTMEVSTEIKSAK